MDHVALGWLLRAMVTMVVLLGPDGIRENRDKFHSQTESDEVRGRGRACGDCRVAPSRRPLALGLLHHLMT